jgi:RHS repeat-associated protein
MRMASKNRGLAITLLSLSLLLVACRKNGTPGLALEECDPAGYITCLQQNAFLSVPITDTNLFLTYSSRWGDHGSRRQSPDATSLGLGGWSLNLVQRYDFKNRLLIGGDGTWRRVDGIKLPSGELAVPSYDGTEAYIFDSAGRHLRTVDGRLGTELVRVSHDSAGRILQVDGSGNGQPAHVLVQRDADGNLRGFVGIDGGRIALSLDNYGRLVVITNPAGETRQIAWTPGGLVASETDPAGGVQQFTYDSRGLLASSTDEDGVTKRFERKSSSDSLEITISTALGRRWTYRAESSKGGIRRTFLGTDGTENSEVTDSRGNRTIRFSDGTTWSIGALSNPVWGMASPILTPIQQTRPDGVGSQREIKYDLQAQQGLPYVLAGSVATTTNGQTWTQHFNLPQHTTDVVDPTGRRSVAEYDEHGRLLNYSAAGAPPVSYNYDAQGRRASVTVGSGTVARTTRYSYDANNGQIITNRPDGIIEKVSVDRAGRRVSATAGDGSATIVSYDSAGRLNRVQPPGGLNFTIGLSSAGRPTAFVPPMVQGDTSIETSSYDKDGRLTGTSGLGNRSVSYSYDSAGRVRSLAFDQGNRSFSYDSHSGLISQASDPSGVSARYAYTSGNLTGLTWTGPIHGSTAVVLDANGRVASESVNGTNNLDCTYDAAGNLVGVGPLSLTRDPATGLVTRTVLASIETQQEFDEYKQLIRATTTAAGKLLFDVRYTRDALGRIKSTTENSADGKTSTKEYSYDRADRLASVRVNGRESEVYSYDPAGNRVSLLRAGKKLQGTYDDRDRLISFGNSQFTWMPDGTLAGVAHGQGASAFVYDDFGALRQASLPDGRKVSYFVDAGGRRVGREVGGKLVAGYLYRRDGSIAAETDSGGTIISRFGYDNGGHLAIVEHSGMTYRVITDVIGSPRLIIDSRTGVVVEQIAYDAWGNVTQDSGPGFVPIGFAGGLHDPDTGLIRFGARDYDPVTGRWTASDPIRFQGRDANLYRYAFADPVNLTDRRGLDSSGGQIVIVSSSRPRFPDPWDSNSSSTSTETPDGNQGANGVTQFQDPFDNSDGSNIVIIVSAWTRPAPQGDAQIGPIDYSYNPPGGGTIDITPVNGGWMEIGPITQAPNGGGGGAGGGGDGGGGGGGSGAGGSGPGGSGPGGSGPSGSGSGGSGSGGPGPGGPGSGNGHGDPHLDSITGLHFDFQAAGEFLIATSHDGTYVIQARQQPLGTRVAVNTAIAANVDADRVGVYAREPSFILVNGSPVNDLDIEKRLPHGGLLQRHGGTVNIRWRSGGSLAVTRVFDSLNYSFRPSAAEAPKLSGLLGRGDGSWYRVTGRDGSMISTSDPDFAGKLYEAVGNSWRIKQSESLFHYWPGESTAKFTNRNFPSEKVTASSIALTRSNAETICRAVGVHGGPSLDDCIFDVEVTGMPAFAAASVGIGINSTPSNPSAPSGSSAASLPRAGGSYSIEIGDTVSPDHPSSGAGTITKPGEKQTYSFSAHAGANVYVKVGPCDGAAPSFEVLQSDDKIVGGTIGCGDFGPLALPAAGNYRLIASADGSSAHFTFTLRPTSFDQYSIRIGDTVSPDHPARGAGIIKDVGQKQSYSFQARAGDAVYLAIGPCEGAQPSLWVSRPDNGGLDGTLASCQSDVGRIDLPMDGTYRIVAQTDKTNVVSHYGFSLLAVPPDQHFAVHLPVTVSADDPARGAGRILAKGEQQFYEFNATQGTKIQIAGKCTASCPGLDVRVVSADEHVSFRYGAMALNKLMYEWILPAGGKYTIQVRSTGYTGEYSFSASEVQAHP